MDDVLLSNDTKRKIEALAQHPPHGLLLAGPRGAGKKYLSRRLAAHILGCSLERLDNYPYLFIAQSLKDSIGIDSVRELQAFLRLKTTGEQTVRRIALIYDAHVLTTEAQNALLKNLEEPPADTVIVLTTNHAHALLPTVLSRMHQVVVKPPTLAQAKDYFSSLSDARAIEKAYLLSGGNVGLLYALLHDNNGHEMLEYISKAKTLLQQSAYERLAHADDIVKLGKSLPELLFALKQIAKAGMKQSALSHNTAGTRRWHAILEQVHMSELLLQKNVNTKLVVTDMLANL